MIRAKETQSITNILCVLLSNCLLMDLLEPLYTS